MSLDWDTDLLLGTTWTWIVTCTDDQGDPVTVATADWRLQTPTGTDVIALTHASGISVVGNVCTIQVETDNQAGVTSRTYRHWLEVVDDNGAITRFMDKWVKVLPR